MNKLLDFISEVSLVDVDVKKDENDKFIAYSLFVLKQVCFILKERGHFDDDKLELLLGIIKKFDKIMWNSYYCCDSITQIWPFIFSIVDSEMDPLLVESILINLHKLTKKFLYNDEDLRVIRFEETLFELKTSFKYFNKSWEENLLWFCNELLREIWSTNYKVYPSLCLELMDHMICIYSNSEYEPLFVNLTRESHLKFIVSYAERL